MTTRELRIGNLVKRLNDLKKIDLSDLECISEGSKIYSGIPLTEEWLLKFGFKKQYSNYIIEAGDYFHSVKKDGEEWIYSYDESDACCYELRSIKHVHQLQNLYFALNDKEL